MKSVSSFYPPTYWVNSLEDLDQINAYNYLLDNYKASDLVAKIIKQDKKIKLLTKKNVEDSVKSLAYKILSLLDNKNREQLKIFGIIGASEESFILMLTSAFLSAHHSICFEELSASAISDRVEIFEPDIIFFTKSSDTKVKNLNLDNISKNIILNCLDIDNLNKEIKSTNNDNFLESLKPKLYKSSDSFFTLYTSGSTGKPKAIVHSVKRYLNFSKFTSEYFFNLNKNSIIFTATDSGWINGHTYAVYGPLSCSAVTIIFENLPRLSDPNLISEIIKIHGITCLYLSVTLLRLLRSNSQNFNFEKNQYPKLERIGSCGEPLANEVGNWAISFFKPKRKTIVNTFFQTETGGILIAPRDEDGIPKDYSSIGKPRKELGVFIAKDELSDDLLKEENIKPDEILIKNPWGGIFQQVLSDRPIDYFTSQGYFRFHDVGFYDDKGFLYVGGRSDDVINSAGHRISSSEIESVCLKLKEIREACVVSISDDLIGEKPILFISTNNGISLSDSELRTLIFELIEKKLTKYHQPYEINIFQNIPKTKSGKIMRRIMRGLCQDLSIDETKDYSTMANLDDFNKSKINYLYEKINYHCNKNNICIDLREFANNCGLRYEIIEIFSSLVIYFYEEISRISSLSHVSAIHFYNNDFDLNYSHKILDKENFINLNNQFLNFLKINSQKSSEFKSFIISYLLGDKNCIKIFIHKKNNYEYKLNFICKTNTSEESIAIRNKMINKILKNFNQSKNIFKNKENKIGRANNNLLCTKCKASLSELRRVRGNEAYLCNVINTDGQNIYICDLCFQGY